MENRSYTNGQLNCETKFAVTWRTLSRKRIFPIQRFNGSTIHAAKAIDRRPERRKILADFN
jgi:hypothetical protein